VGRLGTLVRDQFGAVRHARESKRRADLQHAIALAGDRPERVLALSIPDWGVTPFAKASGRHAAGIAAQIDAFNAVARAACAREGVAFLDITGLTREAGMDPAMLVDDGLHPSAAMYAAWVERIFDEVA
jgi:lysophospholipase L1-like esterase